MTITAPEPDPHERERASGSAAVVGAVAGGSDRAAPGCGELRLLVAPERDDPDAIPELGGTRSPDGFGSSRGAGTPARRLRLAPPVQLELVSGRERAEVVWASLPERAREAVLVLLARLIGSGAVEEDEA